MKIKTTRRYHFTPVKMAIIKEIRDNKCWWRYGEKEMLAQCWYKLKLVQSLCKAILRFLKKLKITNHSSVQLLSHVRLFATPWTAACQTSLSIINSRSLPKPLSIESVMPSNHLILCHPLPLLPSIFPSIRVLSNESVLWIRWPKYWSFSFSISPSNEDSGLISFRMDWFDLLAVQETLESLLQHHR